MKKENEIMKPMSVLRAEFINSLTDLINNSGLPSYIVEPAIKDIYQEVKVIAQKQLESDYQKYNEDLKNYEKTV